MTNTLILFQFQNKDEHVGEVFQDESNMAAILMRRQLENGDLLMVCTFYLVDQSIIFFLL